MVISRRTLPSRRRLALAFVAFVPCATITACVKPAPPPSPRYVVGVPYQAGGVWHYPRESFDLDETGLASVLTDSGNRLTANGETFDPALLAAAHPTLQLPAIARLTDLENGRSIVVRINDRGTGNPRRLIEVTARTAVLLAMPMTGATQVRLQVLGPESRDVAEALPGAPSLVVAVAPRGGVQSADLPPPNGVRQGSGRSIEPTTWMEEVPTRTSPPLRLPEIVTQEATRPGGLFVRLGTFEDYRYAAMQRARVTGLAARIVQVSRGRHRQFRVEIGPLPDVTRAETVLDQALTAGMSDARIVVE